MNGVNWRRLRKASLTTFVSVTYAFEENALLLSTVKAGLTGGSYDLREGQRSPSEGLMAAFRGADVGGDRRKQERLQLLWYSQIKAFRMPRCYVPG